LYKRRKTFLLYPAVLLLLIFLGGACSSGKREVVATIDDEVITRDEVRQRLQAYQDEPSPSGRELPDLKPDERFASARAALEQLIDERLLLLAARREGLIDEDVTAPEKIRTATNEYLDRLGREVPYPSLREAREYYQKHPDEFKTGARYQLDHLLFSSEHSAWEVRNRINRKKLTMTEAGNRGVGGARIANCGKQRLITLQELPPGLAKVVPRLKPGTISQVIATPYGYHLVRVVRKLPAGKIPFAEVENRIKDTIFSRRLQANYQDWLKQSRKQHSIQIFPKHLTNL